ICAVVAAALWGLNFTAIYPVLKIIGSGDNLQKWVKDSIDKVKTEQIDPQQANVDRLKDKAENLPHGPHRARDERQLTGELARAESRLQASRNVDYRLRVAKRYIDMLLPSDPFQTLALILGLVIVAVAVKGLFEFWQESLVGSVVNRMLFDLRNRFYRRAIHLDAQNFWEGGTSEMMAGFTNDIELLGNGQKTLLGKVIAEPLRALACVVFACWISWQLTVMFLVLVPFALFV